MLLVIAFAGTLAIFLGLILAFSGPGENDKQLAARFAAIRLKTVRGLASGRDEDLFKAVAPEASNWLERIVAKLAVTKRITILLGQADSKTTIRKLVVSMIGFALAAAFIAFIFLPFGAVAVVAGLAGGYLPVLFLTMRRGRRINAFNRVLPDAIEMMSRSLRAGYSLIAAISIVAENAAEPVRTEFNEVFRKQNFGLPLRDALMQLLDRVPSQDLRVFVTGVLVQKDTGGNLAEILDRIVAVIRERLKIQGEIRTHTAQGRMTGWVLCLLPLVMLLAINLINPGYSKALTDDPMGRKMLYVGLGLLAFGAFLIRNIVSSVEV